MTAVVERIRNADDARVETMAVLAERVETLRTTAGWQEWLGFAAQLHRYSARNMLLILAQFPTASVVMPFGRKDGTTGWRKVGRCVMKGT